MAGSNDASSNSGRDWLTVLRRAGSSGRVGEGEPCDGMWVAGVSRQACEQPVISSALLPPPVRGRTPSTHCWTWWDEAPPPPA